MNKERIGLFCDEYNISELPPYREISQDEHVNIISRLKRNFGWTYNEQETFNYIEANGEVIFRVREADEESFRLNEVLAQRNIFDEEINVIWSEFEGDVFFCSDFSHYFIGFWLPQADDILIIGVSCEWGLVVTHYGNVVLMQKA